MTTATDLERAGLTAGAPEHNSFIRPAWGQQGCLPDDTKLAWGARAIYSAMHVTKRVRGKLGSTTFEVSIALVHDRCGWSSHPDVTGDDRAALAAWIDDEGIPALRQMCRDSFITPQHSVTLKHASSGYAIEASPRASHGYLYITAWRVEP